MPVPSHAEWLRRTGFVRETRRFVRKLPQRGVQARAHIRRLTVVAPVPGPTYLCEMSFDKIDYWIGKTLFVPPIIKLCQLTRQSQFAVSRLFWFIAALDGFYRAETLFSSILWGGLSVLMMITATRRADSPTRSFVFFRMLGVAFLLFDLAQAAWTGEWAGAEFWVLVLVAEYAATIVAIPPSKASENLAKRAAASRTE